MKKEYFRKRNSAFGYFTLLFMGAFGLTDCTNEGLYDVPGGGPASGAGVKVYTSSISSSDPGIYGSGVVYYDENGAAMSYHFSPGFSLTDSNIPMDTVSSNDFSERDSTVSGEHSGNMPAGIFRVKVGDRGFRDFRDCTYVGKSSFTAGDKIGVFGVKNGVVLPELNNLPLTLKKDGKGGLIWQTPDNAPLKDFPNTSYYAYYPYNRALNTTALTATAFDAAGFFAGYIRGYNPAKAVSYSQADLMTGTGWVIASRQGVKQLIFKLSHQMSLIAIQLPSTTYRFTDRVLPDYVVPAAEVETDGMSPCIVKDGVCYALFNPIQGVQTAPEVHYYDGIKQRAYTLVTKELDSLSKGESRTYDIRDKSRVIRHYLQAGDAYLQSGHLISRGIPLSDEQRGKCIGYVFYVSQHARDVNDYSNTPVGNARCRGYILRTGRSETPEVLPRTPALHSEWQSPAPWQEEYLQRHKAASGNVLKEESIHPKAVCAF